jgi:O-antigen ligase
MNTSTSSLTPPAEAARARASLGQWACALMAVLAPTLVAFHTPPSMTFFNQIVAVVGWGMWLAAMGATLPGVPGREVRTPASVKRGALAVCGMWLVYGAMSLGSTFVWGQLPIGLGLMHAGLCAAAALVFWAAWQSRRGPQWGTLMDLFLWTLTAAGLIGWGIAMLQAFLPDWTDGRFLAEATMPGRAVGNLRQPNHFSTLLVWATAAVAALGGRGRLPVRWACVLAAVFIWGVVLSASRTGMLGMGFLLLWGLVYKGAPRTLRWTLLAAPLIYALWWGVMYAWAHLGTDVTFAAEARLHDHSDISSSRFKIWANVLELIAQHPWAGVGVGEFNVAWSFTPFPTRPLAFFDHTHNVLLQWAVELGLPLATLMLAASLVGLWPLLRGWWPLGAARACATDTPEARLGLDAALGACGVIVAISSLHSMLEYPLWYGHLLLPTAFAWGMGLAAVSRWRGHPAAVASPTSANKSSGAWVSWGGATMAFMGLWCTLDYLAAADIYAPHPGAGPLSERIALSQKMPWWGYQADYAEVTTADDDEPSPPPARFRRTLHNLVDTRLMMAYARSLADHGDVDKARYVVARLREFHNPASKAFMAPCPARSVGSAGSPVAAAGQLPSATADQLPFQCSPPTGHYTWRDVLPRP